ncbi:MAG TPA: hypothetical protein PK385_01105 [Spirochaetota bacterium]|nr:hypothetical protein [Spirochaetota bacterium]HOS32567.1 hypothetical protein [Spirochaetota bacterium]HOS54637.1 hypothetical protein [Spirochaetota bacterium]HPK62907.1 hypothetical protein [Spirochaetota bacterium]HQF77343.1 hypothetical protein [Spirochaetota bacterium]
MNAIYRLEANEINNDFIKSIKNIYKNKRIEIIINEIYDETEYLKKDENNYDLILENIKSDKKVIFNSLQDLMNEVGI